VTSRSVKKTTGSMLGRPPGAVLISHQVAHEAQLE
jgi:hypothetical protein